MVWDGGGATGEYRAADPVLG
ncbi:hypothetical protein CCP3SC1AL1_770002 [Gammaproteobacteria bacterium]